MQSNHFNQHCPDWATALFNGFSQIFLQRHPLCGLLCLLAILYGAPGLLGGALLGGLAGLLTAQRRGYPKAERQAGLYSYNGVLLGLLISLNMTWSPILPLLIIAAGGLSAIMVRHWPRSLPAYTAPFVLLGWALLAFGTSQPAALEADLSGLSPAIIKGFGQVMFLDEPLAGALILVGLLLANRRAVLWAVLGSCMGLAFGLCNDPTQALNGLGGYNATLAALALSPLQRRPWLVLGGMALAILLTEVFITLALPPLTAPFILACWLSRAAARMLRPPLYAQP
ncbi:urea transporter [Pseudomonas vanderleydeniana]|uniref:Urea transporter n=1 Tax=Pseudomonas vanderleydeniana TaxID=2745495 RepID=A0A9E6PP70_9PSED|nr:urea transporter [Pseudomonas vanderleydeniana]QXI30139.1 urea transporter [Pseudomonas vanderleydeniana]